MGAVVDGLDEMDMVDGLDVVGGLDAVDGLGAADFWDAADGSVGAGRQAAAIGGWVGTEQATVAGMRPKRSAAMAFCRAISSAFFFASATIVFLLRRIRGFRSGPLPMVGPWRLNPPRRRG